MHMIRTILNAGMNFKTRLYVKLFKPKLAAKLDDVYFARRDPLIQSLIVRLRDGETLTDVLREFDGNLYDERICEYPYVVHWLLEMEKGSDLLDIGCVMNNKLMTTVVRELCGRVWLLNPARDPIIHLQNPLQYELARLEAAFENGEQFPCITCLSTIEHIGFDNSQYRVESLPAYYRPTDEPLISSVSKIADLLAPGGSVLISVPFGYREALIHPGTLKIASQVFDQQSMDRALDTFSSRGVRASLEIFEADSKGWKQVDAQRCAGRYAHGVPAARAVAFIRGTKGA